MKIIIVLHFKNVLFKAKIEYYLENSPTTSMSRTHIFPTKTMCRLQQEHTPYARFRHVRLVFFFTYYNRYRYNKKITYIVFCSYCTPMAIFSKLISLRVSRELYLFCLYRCESCTRALWIILCRVYLGEYFWERRVSESLNLTESNTAAGTVSENCSRIRNGFILFSPDEKEKNGKRFKGTVNININSAEKNVFGKARFVQYYRSTVCFIPSTANIMKFLLPRLSLSFSLPSGPMSHEPL